MGGGGRGDASIQAFFPPTPIASSSPPKNDPKLPSSDAPIGDGFNDEELRDALKPKQMEWQPQAEYTEMAIRDLQPGPRAVTFMGRIANIYDVIHTQKKPRAAKGCLKLCVKDDKGAITIRLWYANRVPAVRLGSLVSVWTDHISNGENGVLSSASAPLFASLFPERDRSCHLMVHQNSDTGTMYKLPLGYREGRPLNGVMTLQNFIDGGYDVTDAKILVVVKSIGAKRKVIRKDNTTVENINLQVHDDTAEAPLGLWGTSASSPAGLTTALPADSEAAKSTSFEALQPWNPGSTVLLLESPGWKLGRGLYLSLTTSTLVDVNPSIPDTLYLRKFSLRQRSREAVNPAFPEDCFDLDLLKNGPIRCLYTLADLDEFARAAPGETFQGYLSVIIMECKLYECWRRNMLFSGDCCSLPIYANALSACCKGCGKDVLLRLSPKVLGQVVDETGCVSGGKMILSDDAWKDLLGRKPEVLLRWSGEGIKGLADRLVFARVTLLFGWTGDETKAGGRICVMGVAS